MSDVAKRLNALGVATPSSMVEYAQDARNGLIEQIANYEEHLRDLKGSLIQVEGILAALADSAQRATN